MATSGYFDGAKSTYGWYARLEYSYTQNTVSTVLTLTLKVYNGTKPAYNNNANSAYYIIDGTKTYATYNWQSIGWNTIGSKTVTLASGVTSYSTSAQWVSAVTSNWTPASLSVSGTISNIPEINPLKVSAPSNVTVEEGKTATFSVTASGGSAYTYQWYFDGSAVSNATTSTYTRTAALADNNKKVYCVVTSGSYSVTSASATLYVTEKVVPTLYVTNIPEVYTAYLGDKFTFSVTVLGGSSYTYYWYVEGDQIPDGKSVITNNKTCNTYVPQDGNKVYCLIQDASGATIETNKCVFRVGLESATTQLTSGINYLLVNVGNKLCLPMVYSNNDWSYLQSIIGPADVNNPALINYAVVGNAVIGGSSIEIDTTSVVDNAVADYAIVDI